MSRRALPSSRFYPVEVRGPALGNRVGRLGTSCASNWHHLRRVIPDLYRPSSRTFGLTRAIRHGSREQLRPSRVLSQHLEAFYKRPPFRLTPDRHHEASHDTRVLVLLRNVVAQERTKVQEWKVGPDSLSTQTALQKRLLCATEPRAERILTPYIASGIQRKTSDFARQPIELFW